MDTVKTESQTTRSTPPKITKTPTPTQIALRRLVRNKMAMIGLSFLIIVILASIFAPYLTPFDPTKTNLYAINKAPSEEHMLGTDSGGRDVVARLLYGGRISLGIGFSVTFLVMILSTGIGAIAGYFGGRVDQVIMRFIDFMMNFPTLILIIVINSIFMSAGVLVLILVMSFFGWAGGARLVRGKILSEKENEYVLSAVSVGCSPAKVIFKHLLPNIISLIIVRGTLMLAGAMVIETGLSFLGFGVPASVPSWGKLLAEARDLSVIQYRWWIWTPPAALLTLTILSINFLGEGLKEAFDPRSGR